MAFSFGVKALDQHPDPGELLELDIIFPLHPATEA